MKRFPCINIYLNAPGWLLSLAKWKDRWWKVISHSVSITSNSNSSKLIWFGSYFVDFLCLFNHSNRSARWWRLAVHIEAFDIFRFGIVSVQRFCEFIGESMLGIWPICWKLDWHRSHKLRDCNDRQKWIPSVDANLLGSHFVSNVDGT